MTWHMRTAADANSNDPYLPKTTEEKAGCPDPDRLFAAVMTLQAWQPYPTGGASSGTSTVVAVDTEFTYEVPNTDTPAVSDTTAPFLSAASATVTGTTTATVSVNTDEGNGRISVVCTQSSSSGTVDNIENGEDSSGLSAAYDGQINVSSAGTYNFLATGLSASTLYFAYSVHRDAAGNVSNITSASFTTQAIPDTTAPILTLPTGVQTGSSTATLSVNTDEGNGTAFTIAKTSATPPPALDVINGVGAVYAGNQPVTTFGTKTFSATGLAPSTTYYAHFTHRDAANNISNVVTTTSFTTTAPAPPVVANQAIEFGQLTQVGAGGAPLVNTGGAITSVALGTRTVGSAHWNTTAYPIIPTTIPSDAQYVWTGCTATGPTGTSAPFTLTINTVANTYSVANTTEYQAILTLSDATRSGKTMKLRSGAAYSTQNLFGKFAAMTGVFTIESHDHSNKAIIANFSLDASSGPIGNVDFRYIDFYRLYSTMGPPYSLVYLGVSAENIGFYFCGFHAGYGKARDGQLFDGNENYGINFPAQINGLTIHDCSFYDIVHCVFFEGANISAKRNEFYNFSGDAFQIGSSTISVGESTEYIVIEDNYMHDPVGNGQVHQDFIQAFSRGATTIRDINGVTVRGNVIVWGVEGRLAPHYTLGVGQVGTQGIQNADNVPKNHNFWLVEGNVFETAQGNCINFEMSGNRGNIIRNNTFVPVYTSGAFAGTSSGAPLIRLNGKGTNTIYNNTLTAWNLTPATDGAVLFNNHVFGTSPPLSTQTAVFQGTTFEPANKTEMLNNVRMKANAALDTDNSGTVTFNDKGAVGTTVANGFWDFTNKAKNAVFTGTGAPTVTTLFPADGATGVDPSTNLVITFNEPVVPNPAGGNIVIHKASDNSVVQSFAILTCIENNTIVFDGAAKTVTVNPTTLVMGSYYVKIDAGAIRDPWGNAYAGITTTTGWNFDISGAVTLVEVRVSGVFDAVSLPVLLPAGVFAGDILLAQYHCTLGTGPATPAGWTLETSQDNASGTNTRYGGLYWKIASAGDASASAAGTAAVTFVHGTAVTNQAVCIYVLRNAVDLEAASTDYDTAASSLDPVSLTPSWGAANNMWLAMVSYGRTSLAGISAYPAGYAAAAEEKSLDVTAGELDIHFIGSTRSANIASEDPSAYTISLAVSAVVYTVAVKPSAAPGDTTAPLLTAPFGTQTGSSTATLGATTNEGNGDLYTSATTSATPPNAAGVIGGTGATYFTSQPVTSTGAKTFSATGLSASTTYYPYFMQQDAAGNQSLVAAGASFTTAGGVVTADIVAITKNNSDTTPTASLPIAIPTGTTDGKRMLLIWSGNTGDLPTTPSGWNVLANTDQAAASLGRRHIVYERLGTTSMTTFNLVHAATINQVAICVLLNNGAMPEAVSTDNADANWQPDPLSLTPAGGSKTYLWIAAVSHGRDPTRLLSSYPANCPDDRDHFTTNAVGTDMAMGIASATVTAATFNPDAYALSSTSSGCVWTIAVPPG